MLTYAFPNQPNYLSNQRWKVGDPFPFANHPKAVTLVVDGDEVELLLNAIKDESTREVLLYVPSGVLDCVSSGVYSATASKEGKITFHHKETRTVHTISPGRYIKHNNGSYSATGYEVGWSK